MLNEELQATTKLARPLPPFKIEVLSSILGTSLLRWIRSFLK
jgi:hypothetical protein